MDKVSGEQGFLRYFEDYNRTFRTLSTEKIKEARGNIFSRLAEIINELPQETDFLTRLKDDYDPYMKDDLLLELIKIEWNRYGPNKKALYFWYVLPANYVDLIAAILEDPRVTLSTKIEEVITPGTNKQRATMLKFGNESETLKMILDGEFMKKSNLVERLLNNENTWKHFSLSRLLSHVTSPDCWLHFPDNPKLKQRLEESIPLLLQNKTTSKILDSNAELKNSTRRLLQDAVTTEKRVYTPIEMTGSKKTFNLESHLIGILCPSFFLAEDKVEVNVTKANHSLLVAIEMAHHLSNVTQELDAWQAFVKTSMKTKTALSFSALLSLAVYSGNLTLLTALEDFLLSLTEIKEDELYLSSSQQMKKKEMLKSKVKIVPNRFVSKFKSKSLKATVFGSPLETAIAIGSREMQNHISARQGTHRRQTIQSNEEQEEVEVEEEENEQSNTPRNAGISLSQKGANVFKSFFRRK